MSSVANVVVSCLLCRQQEHAGLNPTESMTRALISDDNIARPSALGTVQLGYVLPLLVTPSILRRARSQKSKVLKNTSSGSINYAQGKIFLRGFEREDENLIGGPVSDLSDFIVLSFFLSLSHLNLSLRTTPASSDLDSWYLGKTFDALDTWNLTGPIFLSSLKSLEPFCTLSIVESP